MVEISGYRAMWLFVMFDLPVETRIQRKLAANFRKDLLKDGFSRIQYSVYARPCPSQEIATVHSRRVRLMIPPEGEVRILQVTDKQFGYMQCFFGKLPSKPEKAPQQLELF